MYEEHAKYTPIMPGELPVRNLGKSPSFQMCRKWAQWLIPGGLHCVMVFMWICRVAWQLDFKEHSPLPQQTQHQKTNFGIFLKGKGLHKWCSFSLQPTTSSKWFEFLPKRTVSSTDLVVGDLVIIEINYELTQVSPIGHHLISKNHQKKAWNEECNWYVSGTLEEKSPGIQKVEKVTPQKF